MNQLSRKLTRPILINCIRLSLIKYLDFNLIYKCIFLLQYYESEYGAKYKEPEITVPLPLEQKVAGLSSLSSKAVREPAFTQKRKVGSQRGVNDRVVQGVKFSEDKMNLVHLCLCVTLIQLHHCVYQYEV